MICSFSYRINSDVNHLLSYKVYFLIFYSKETIGSVKKKLFFIGVRLLGDIAGEFKDCRPGGSKNRLDNQDLLELYEKLD